MSGSYWQDTFNPIRGCSHAGSPGCDHCWARDMHKRFRSEPFEQVTLLPEVLSKPLHRRKPTTYFVCNTSDLYHPSVPFEFIAAVYGVMAACPQHTFLTCTKRPERQLEFMGWLQTMRLTKARGSVVMGCIDMAREYGVRIDGSPELVFALRDFGENIWKGVTAENQAMADERIPLLLQTPAAHRWVSVEPMLGGVDLQRYMWPTHWHWDSKYKTPEEALANGGHAERHRQSLVAAGSRFVDQVIIGGESGPGARPCELEWIRSLVRQARNASVPCFVKQLGSRAMFDDQIKVDEWEHCRYPSFSSSGSDPSEWPEDLQVRELAWRIG